jgi:hypothetical protein
MQNEETEVWRGAPKQSFILLQSTFFLQRALSYG